MKNDPIVALGYKSAILLDASVSRELGLITRKTGLGRNSRHIFP